MNKEQIVLSFWENVAKQNADILCNYFTESAIINWHNTNESFTLPEYIIANCEYPGKWNGEVERIETKGNLVITVARVWMEDENASFHATSFFKFDNDKISILDEYWGDDGVAPQWRIDKHIGTSIK